MWVRVPPRPLALRRLSMDRGLYQRARPTLIKLLNDPTRKSQQIALETIRGQSSNAVGRSHSHSAAAM